MSFNIFSFGSTKQTTQQQHPNTTQIIPPSTSPISRGRKTISKDSSTSNTSSNSKTNTTFEQYSSQTADVWDARDVLTDDYDLKNFNKSSKSPSSTNLNSMSNSFLSNFFPGPINKQPTKLNTDNATPKSNNGFRSSSNNNTDHLLAVRTAAKMVIERQAYSEKNQVDQECQISDIEDNVNSPISPASALLKIRKQSNSESSLKCGNSPPKIVENQTENLTTLNTPPVIAIKDQAKVEKFDNLLKTGNLEIAVLRKAAWAGIPNCHRGDVWRLLCGYMPCSLERRSTALNRKRNEYSCLIRRYYDSSNDPEHSTTFRQIFIDIPRTHPGIELFQIKQCQDMLQRLLFIWSIRHPASGYVQGINDLATPFMISFILDVMYNGDLDKIPNLGKKNTCTELLQEDVVRIVEADTFWCLTKLLDTIQDHFTFAQPGIHRQLQALTDIVKRVDIGLHNHIIDNHIEYHNFAFRWMNNLLMRELPLRCVIRLWDAYLAESDGFVSLHLFVCTAFLLHWKQVLFQQTDFQGLLMLLQNLPTSTWKDDNIELLLAEAYKLKYEYGDSPAHYSRIP